MHRSISRRLNRIVHGLVAACVSLHAAAAVAAPPAAGAKQVADFSLVDTRGTKHSINEWRRSKAVVLFFIGTECPVSNGYAPDMQQIATRYAEQGVACFGVHADPSVTSAAAAEHAKQYSLTFPILLDPEQVLAQSTAARVTPEAVVVSPTGKVLYRGRIDDRYATDGKRRDDATVQDLENALRAVLSGAAPAVSDTKAFGCPLPKPRASAR
jgi:peroxiredoxin